MSPTGPWRQLTQAPHRMFFASGLAWLLVFSAWWVGVLALRAAGLATEPALPALFAHAASMLYLVFTPFFLGFLFTVFPRWMPAPETGRATRLAVFGLLNAGNAAFLAGLYLSPSLLLAGWSLAAAGVAVAGLALGRGLALAESRAIHAWPVVAGFAAGVAGMAAFAAAVGTGSFQAWPWVRAAGLWGFVLPVYFAVCHRMIPFFTSRVIPGYIAWRPAGVLWSFSALCLLMVGLEGLPAWRWAASWPLAALAGLCAVNWAPGRRGGPALLTTLHVAFAWLVAGLVLTAAGDLAHALGRPGLLGRAPVHALGIGFFGGMLMAMVTRVTMGHSGRTLAMDAFTWRLFVVVQAAAGLRVAAELAPPLAEPLTLLAGFAWLGAFSAWAARHAGAWFRPRVDGRPG